DDLEGARARGRQLLHAGDEREAQVARRCSRDRAQTLIVRTRARQDQVGADALDARRQRLPQRVKVDARVVFAAQPHGTGRAGGQRALQRTGFVRGPGEHRGHLVLVRIREREGLRQRDGVVAAQPRPVGIGRRRVQADDDVHGFSVVAPASAGRLAASSLITVSVEAPFAVFNITSAGARGGRGADEPRTAPTRLRGVPEIAGARPPTATTTRGTDIAMEGAAAAASTTTTPAGAAAASFANAASPSDGSTMISVDASAAAANSS